MNGGKQKRKVIVLVVDPLRDLEPRVRAAFAATPRTDADDHDLFLADSYGSAAGMFTDWHPDLVLIAADPSLAEAKDFCVQVRQKEGARHTGLVFFSNSRYSDQEDVSADCLEAGADDYVLSQAGPAEIKGRLKTVLRMKAMTDELRTANHRLAMISQTDDLSGLANMRGFNGKYIEALRACREGTAGIGVIMMDMDRFKLVNDNTHHLMGSHVLASIGRAIRESGILDPAHDLAARYGGDEFIVFCSTSDLNSVVEKAKAIHKMIKDTEYVYEGHKRRITASLGVALVEPGFKGAAEDVIKAADLTLYRSKTDGRDRVTVLKVIDGMKLDEKTYSLMLAETKFDDDGVVVLGKLA